MTTASKTIIKKYKLYALDNYMKRKDFVDNGYIEYGIKSLIKELENDKGYHMRIHPRCNYIFFGDCDGFRGSFNDFANLFMCFLDKYYEIKLQLNDFSYTANDSKKGSFHYSVPKLYASAEKLKEIHLCFFEEHKHILYDKETKTKIVDVSVYTEHWFRYPMQSKAGDKNAIHHIKKGLIVDFVVEHIPKKSKCIENELYKKIDAECSEKVQKKCKNNNLDDTSDNDFSDDEIEILINMLSSERYDDYDSWLNVGICLRNISKDYLLLWKKWSKLSEKYDKNVCNDKWKSFNKNTDKNLTIGSLRYWCNEDNPDQYKEFMKKRRTMNIINNKFIGIDLKFGETKIVTKDMSYIDLHNKKCIIFGDEHIQPSMYIEKMEGKLIIKCKHIDCFGKTYPCEHVHLTKNEMNIMNNGTIIINNYNIDDQLIEFQKYEIFENEEINTLIFKSLTGTNSPMADVIYYYYKNDYNIGENGNWYEFKNHKWIMIGSNNNAFMLVVEMKLEEIYDKLISYGQETRMESEKIKMFKKIRKSFSVSQFRKDTMVIIKERFEARNNPNRDFVKSLDKNRHLIVFNNGVYDLKTFTFRDGTPSDCMTMSVNYDYIDTHTNYFNDLHQFLSDIQPDKRERNFLLTYLSSGLWGNTLEWFTIFTGKGRNGKSKFVELIKYTFSNYYSAVKSQIFTRPMPDAQCPDPGLLNLRHKKIVTVAEPDRYGRLNTGFIKFISGNDSIEIRGCHKDAMIDFAPNFITFFICNEIPETDGNIDFAFSERLRCINFPTEFCTNPKKNSQKLIDLTIGSKLNLWKADFMLLLIKKYKEYKLDNTLLIIPPSVLEWTNRYKEDTDIYLKFLSDCTEDCIEDNEFRISTSELFEAYKIWLKNADRDEKEPKLYTFTKNIKKYKDVKNMRIEKEGKTTSGISNLKLK
jgi:P4 family phage/plasmid primase-like protien